MGFKLPPLKFRYEAPKAMANDLLLREGEGATAAVSNGSHHSDSPSPNENKVIDGVDFISSLPDVILQIILSFIPTKFAIRTSALSTRWRHVWCGTPSLSIDFLRRKRNEIMETLTRLYSAPKIMSSHLCISDEVNSGKGVCVVSFILPTTTKSQVDSLIEFGMSEKMSLEIRDPCFGNYEFPDFFYADSSLKQLSVDRGKIVTVPTVSWTSLRILSLTLCRLSDESFAKILSGSPLLESLTLCYCLNLEHLDLSESLHLRRLSIEIRGPMEIVAPHVHCLRLSHTQFECGLVNVSSLIEADVEITCTNIQAFCSYCTFETDWIQQMVMEMLEMLQNAKKLTFGAMFLQILSLAEACGVPFPTLKVEVLTLETVIAASVIPGIAKLLQNSPSLKKVKLKLDMVDCLIIPDSYLKRYLHNKGVDTYQCCRKPKDWVFPTSEAEPMKFMQFLLANTQEND